MYKPLLSTLVFYLLSHLVMGQAFVTTWKTDNNGTSDDNQITIPTTDGTYDYSVDWGDGSTDDNVTGDITHTYSTAGTYTVSITGDFPRIYFNNSGDAEKLMTIEAWGDIAWSSMHYAFAGCSNMTYNATDAPDLSGVTATSYMFFNATAFNGAIGNWDMSTVITTRSMFVDAENFNQDISAWNVSSVTDMVNMFNGCASFNQDIGGWDVSSVVQMTQMFRDATAFNQDLSTWDVSSVTSFNYMFTEADAFNGDISTWNTSSGTTMEGMFSGTASFNQPIGNWDVSSVVTFRDMFSGAIAFNQDIGNWNLSSATTIESMFQSTWAFNQNINAWDVSNITTATELFDGASAFNQPLDNWTFSALTNYTEMFRAASAFNQDISNWDMSGATDLTGMFWSATAFNQPLDSWDVSNVTEMDNMFRDAQSFNQDLNSWNVSNLNNATAMFFFANSFNGDVTNWDVSNVTQMVSFFNQATAFDQDISLWNVSSATNMSYMFSGASSFNQDLSGWDVSNVTDLSNFLYNTSTSKSNYDKLLIAWSQLTLQEGISFRTNAKYCNGADAKQSIIDTYGWTFVDGGPNCVNFITTWKTDNTGDSDDNQITIPTTGDGYSYSVNWGDGETDTEVTGDITHTYAAPGTYYVHISGDFPRIFFNNAGDKDKILSVESWGDIAWSSMEFAFAGCHNLVINATDAPDLSEVTSIRYMFNNAKTVNSDLNHWDVSHVTNMFGVFYGANAFNGAVGNWDVSQVTNMQALFGYAYVFDQDLSNWDVSSVVQMKDVFFRAFAFNQDISGWDVSNVVNMRDMFYENNAFNQDLSAWDVSGVTNFIGMFKGADVFDQNLGDWNISSATDMTGMLDNTGLSKANYDQTLMGWSAQTVQNSVAFGAAGLKYCHGAEARETLTGTYGWTISGDELECQPFVTTWKTDNEGTSGDNQITIPVNDYAYNYDVDWGDGNSDMGVTGSITHTYDTPGTYTVSISGIFPAIYFNNEGDKDKILTVEQWGDIQWASMDRAFYGCSQLTVPAVDRPDLSNVTSMARIFFDASVLNNDINHWDVSNITDMSYVFAGANLFDQPLNNWDVSSVTNMKGMFSAASVFNQDLDQWDVSSVTDMSSMFGDAALFNGNIGTWDVSNVTTMFGMFFRAHAIDQDLSNWDVSSVQTMASMFGFLTNFNIDISAWDVSNVNDFRSMFSRCQSFNQDIGVWDMSSATQITGMFYQAYAFDQDISGWDVSGVGSLHNTFYQATSLKADLSGWNVSNVQSLEGAFSGATSFDQDLSAWDVSNVTNMTNTFSESGLSRKNYDKILNGWSELTLQSGVTFDAVGIEYCDGADARQSIIDTFSWTINDGGQNCIVEIPDANFKAILLANEEINTTDDGEITLDEAAAFTGTISASAADISDITGIECFVNLTGLTLGNNSVSNPDLSNNTALTTLNLVRNGINSIDLSKNSNLNYLNLVDNNISSIDLSVNTSLTQLFLGENNLSTIDVSGLTGLINLGVQDNNLSALDISQNTAIQLLYAQGNGLSTIDISNQESLSTLYLSNNDFTEVDLSNNPGLVQLRLDGNQLTDLDFSSHTSLTALWLNNNALTSLDLRNGNNEAITSFKLSGNADLTCVSVDHPVFARDNWTDVDDQEIFRFSCNPDDILHIPDANFKTALLDNTEINTTDDGEITYGEAWTFEGELDVSSLSIADFTGIEAFTKMIRFTATGNTATSIDVSNNRELLYLFMYSVPLASLDVSHNTKLLGLQFGNNITFNTIDLSNNTELFSLSTPNTDALTTILGLENLTKVNYLYIQGCNIESLDLRNCTSLRQLRAYNNNLSFLDLRNGMNEFINLYESQGNDGLTCISVDNPAYAKQNWENVDDPDQFSLSCDPDEVLEIPDANFKAYLLGNTAINTTDDGEITFGEADAFTGSLLPQSLEIEDLTGIKYFQNVTILAAAGNLLTEVDVSQNVGLTTLSLNSNSLTDIDLSNNTNLTSLRLGFNELTEIDLSANVNLTTLHVYQNDLSSLDLSTNTALVDVSVHSNQLTSLDVSGLTQLVDLEVGSQPLASLDVTQNTALQYLDINDTDLSSIDLSANTDLLELKAQRTSISAIDLSDNTSLTLLYLLNNGMNSLDLTANTALVDLRVQNNHLTSLDLSALPSLEIVEVHDNQLDELIIQNGNNTAITDFDATNNADLVCILVDDVDHFETNFSTNIDEQSTFYTICPNDETDMLSFELDAQTGAATINNVDHTVSIEVAYGTDVSALEPVISLSEGATLSPTGAQDFSSTFSYTVTAENGVHMEDWEVTVSIAPNTETDILTFVLADQTGDAVIDATNHTVAIEVAYGSDISSLEPTITVSAGATLSPTGAQDFSEEVTYIVTAEEGVTMQDWTVNVSIAPSNETDILTFVLADQTGDALIDAINHTVAIEVAYGTDISSLEPTITVSAGATLSPTGAQDFSEEVTYSVTAEDGVTMQDWAVNVSIAPSNETDILTFVLAEQTGDAVIDATHHTVTIEVEHLTDLTGLVPAITISEGATITPTGTQDFSNAVEYTVTAEDGVTTQAWLSTVSLFNTVPEATHELSDVTFDNGFVLGTRNLASTFTDADGDALTLQATSSDQSVATVEFDGTTLNMYEQGAGLTTITVTASDGFGGSISLDFLLTINFVAQEAPSDLSLSNNTIDENSPVTTQIGTLSATDVNIYDEFTYSFATGEGDTDNASFSLSGNALLSAEVFDFESQTTYSIRLQVSDQHGASFAKAFTIAINDLDDNTAPVVVNPLADASENEGFDTIELDLSQVFEDADGDELTIEATSSETGVVTVLVSTENKLVISEVGIGTSTITITATDAQGETAMDSFEFEVIEVFETGTDILTFVLNEQTGDAVIDDSNHTITVEVSHGTDVSALTPAITLSEGATVSPSGEQDFSSPVTYTVTAEDGVTTQDWVVTVTVEEPPLSVSSAIKLKTYPNPASRYLQIEGMNLAAGQFRMMGQDGRIYSSVQLVHGNQLDVSSLPVGAYYLSIRTEEFTTTTTILIRR